MVNRFFRQLILCLFLPVALTSCSAAIQQEEETAVEEKQ
jgi:hypothetical protein